MVNETPLMLIRADGGGNLGTGHMMRCLALAQGWKLAGGKAIFVSAITTPSLMERILLEGFAVERLELDPGSQLDARATASLAKVKHAQVVVIDGYHFNSDYQEKILEAQIPMLVIDDCAEVDHYHADWVLNQNIYAIESMYPNRDPGTKLLLGTRYALLRQEFSSWRNRDLSVVNPPRRILITMGGSDPGNVTTKVLEALDNLQNEDIEVAVVIGGSNQNVDEVYSCARSLDIDIDIEVKRDVSDMPELMAWADLAISASGSTCWELLYMCLPSLLIVQADNQLMIAKELHERGAAINLGWHGDLPSERISEALRDVLDEKHDLHRMSDLGRRMIDGYGVNRVIALLMGRGYYLRRAEPSDRAIFWEWANEPDARQASFSQEAISWGEHVSWFDHKLTDPGTVLLVADNTEGIPLGQVRFDLGDDGAIISISVDKRYRGRGYGTQLIAESCRVLWTEFSKQIVNAYIKLENRASVGIFRKAGFKEIDRKMISGSPALHMQLKDCGGRGMK